MVELQEDGYLTLRRHLRNCVWLEILPRETH